MDIPGEFIIFEVGEGAAQDVFVLFVELRGDLQGDADAVQAACGTLHGQGDAAL